MEATFSGASEAMTELARARSSAETPGSASSALATRAASRWSPEDKSAVILSGRARALSFGDMRAHCRRRGVFGEQETGNTDAGFAHAITRLHCSSLQMS